MKTTISLIAICALACATSGCNDDGDTFVEVAAPEPVALTGKIQGQLYDLLTQSPVADATVTLWLGEEAIIVTSNDAGIFAFVDVPVTDGAAGSDDAYLLTVTNAAGYADQFAQAALMRSEANTPNAALVANVEVGLHPATGTITGTVVDVSTGLPVEGAEVTLQPDNEDRFAVANQSVTSDMDGRFVLENVPEVARYDVRIICEGFVTVVYHDAYMPGGSAMNLNALSPDEGGELVGGLGIGIYPAPDTAAGDTQRPVALTASITPYQDLSVEQAALDITIGFSEPLSPFRLDLIRLRRLGFKGAQTDVFDDAFPNVLIAAKLIGDGRTLLIDIDPVNEPGLPLAAGQAYALTGFDTLMDVNGNFLDGSDEYSILLKRYSGTYLPFTTNANVELIALSSAPRQVDGSADHDGSRLQIDLAGLIPDGARGFRVYAAETGTVTDPNLFCFVTETGLVENPPTAISTDLWQVDNALWYCGRGGLDNSHWDDGLHIDVVVSIVNQDGLEGPMSAVLTAHDNVRPALSSVDNYHPYWKAGRTGDFEIRLYFTEDMNADALLDLSNYEFVSVDDDGYALTGVTLSHYQVVDNDVTRATLNFELQPASGGSDGTASIGDAVVLGIGIVDETGNPIVEDRDTVVVGMYGGLSIVGAP